MIRAQFKDAFASGVVCVVCPLFVMRLVHTSYIYAQTVYYTQECSEYYILQSCAVYTAL